MNGAEQPLVSVVIPTYERPDMLRKSVESVVAQTYRPIEILVVDDHSTRPARAVLSDVSTGPGVDIRHVRHPENRGISATRNSGIALASGVYVAFLDDDDRWDERKLSAQVERFRECDERVGVVYTGVTYTDGETSTVETPGLRGEVTRELLVGRSLAPTSAIMVRRTVLTAVGGFDEQLPSWNDRDLYVRLSKRCEFEPVREPLTTRISEAGSVQISRNYGVKRDVTYPRFQAKHRPTAAEIGRWCERQFLATVRSMLAKSAMMNGRYGEARRYFLRSVRWNPFSLQPYLYLLPVLGGRYTYRSAERVKNLLSTE